MASIAQSLMNVGTAPWRHLGAYQDIVDDVLASLREAGTTRRIWGRDGTLWGSARTAVVGIEKRLGWLDLPDMMPLEIGRLRAFEAEIRAARLNHVVLLGMGGSSLAAEVLADVIGPSPGYAHLTVLDSTDPAQIREVVDSLSLANTLFIVASKSGTTTETQALYTYLRHRCREELGPAGWPRHFVAITDEGTPLQQMATDHGMRAVFPSPGDVGGRFSALSLFGLVPAALMGIDLDLLLRRGREMSRACRVTLSEGENPAIVLGAALGGLAARQEERLDKLSLITSPRLTSFGAWVEQLVAESTGKGGKGIVPVVGRVPNDLDALSRDRVWVYLRLDEDDNERTDALCSALLEREAPVLGLRMRDVYDLGAEFFRWEFAIAVAGRCLGVNPFDQPDVDAAKRQTQEALSRYKETQALPEEEPALTDELLSIYGTCGRAESVPACLAEFWGQARPGDYGAILAFVARNEENARYLHRLADDLEVWLGIPVTVGFGPRYLHSTGQLHKGGPNTLLAMQVTQDDGADLDITGEAYSFGVLERAQALGDLRALRNAGRRAMRVHLGEPAPGGLNVLLDAVRQAHRFGR